MGSLQNEKYSNAPFEYEKASRIKQKALLNVENQPSRGAIILAPMTKSAQLLKISSFSVLCRFLYIRKMSFFTLRLRFHPVLLEIKRQCEEKQLCLYVLLSCCQESSEAEVIL